MQRAAREQEVTFELSCFGNGLKGGNGTRNQLIHGLVASNTKHRLALKPQRSCKKNCSITIVGNGCGISLRRSGLGEGTLRVAHHGDLCAVDSCRNLRVGGYGSGKCRYDHQVKQRNHETRRAQQRRPLPLQRIRCGSYGKKSNHYGARNSQGFRTRVAQR
ncbi:hypothetical protein GCM10009106_03490 [Sphingomonas japonica]